ncbi:MAG TPA: sugar phosphate isomerase/epimerase family protein [Blastocatellia bacterium]|jgi:D-psicose/D-tagatose/L-ribulose 3-epimerase
MNNPIAACTWIFGQRDLADIAARLAAMGLDGAEIFINPRLCSPRELHRIFADQGLRVFSMTPENVDIAHASGNQRALALDDYFRLIDFAAELGARAITCHEFVGRTQPHDGAEQEWARLSNACERIAARAAANHLDVVFEPLNRSLVSAVRTAGQAMNLVAAVNAPRFGVVLDTYHMHREENDPAAAIRHCGAALKAIQLADSGRGRIGSGTIDFGAQLGALAAIGYGGPLILECSSLPGPSWTNREVAAESVETDLRESLSWLRTFRLRLPERFPAQSTVE